MTHDYGNAGRRIQLSGYIVGVCLFWIDSSQLYWSLGQQQLKKKKKIQTGQNWTFQADLLSTVQTEKQNMKDSLLVITGNGFCLIPTRKPENLKSTTFTVAPPCGQNFTCIKNKIQNHIPVFVFFSSS